MCQIALKVLYTWRDFLCRILQESSKKLTIFILLIYRKTRGFVIIITVTCRKKKSETYGFYVRRRYLLTH